MNFALKIFNIKSTYVIDLRVKNCSLTNKTKTDLIWNTKHFQYNLMFYKY